MVLEKIVSIRDALKKPYWMFIIGGLISTICLFISFLIFPQATGIFTTFLITITMMPFMVNLITYEAATTEQEIQRKINMNFFDRHKDVLLVYILFFAGMILTQSIIYLMLPEPIVERLFEDQIREINWIRGSLVFGGLFEKIIINNLGVLILSYLFSFLFGAGAIFILTWNSSVLSTAIGLTAKSIGGVKGLPVALLIFFPHGSLELIAYFIGAIAGGLVSASLTRRKTKLFWEIIKDSLLLLVSAIFILIVAGLIEVALIYIA